MILDCSGINKEGPGRFRTEADKTDFQNCYFNVANKEHSCNEFLSQHINSNEADDRIHFKIIHFKSKVNRGETFDPSKELCDLKNNNGSNGTTAIGKRLIFRISYGSGSSIMNSSNSGRKSTQSFSSGTRERAKPKVLLE